MQEHTHHPTFSAGIPILIPIPTPKLQGMRAPTHLQRRQLPYQLLRGEGPHPQQLASLCHSHTQTLRQRTALGQLRANGLAAGDKRRGQR